MAPIWTAATFCNLAPTGAVLVVEIELVAVIVDFDGHAFLALHLGAPPRRKPRCPDDHSHYARWRWLIVPVCALFARILVAAALNDVARLAALGVRKLAGAKDAGAHDITHNFTA
jgi:hypothetical protein